jgi:hypothetical protein
MANDKDKDKKESSGFCANFFYGFAMLIYYSYQAIKWCILFFFNCMSFIWYPLKERLVTCCQRIGKKQRP